MPKNTSEILYEMIVSDVIKRIDAGELQPGDRLPTEKALGEKYHVSRVTVRKAIELLTERGVVRRIPNKGAYINGPKLHFQNQRSQTFQDYMDEEGIESTSKILSMSIVQADILLAEKFQCREGEKILCIERIRCANDIPYGVQTLYLRQSLFPDFNPWLLAKRDLKDIVENDYGYTLFSATHNITPEIPPESVARELEVGSGMPILHINTIGRLSTGEIFEYNHMYLSTEVVKYSFTWYGHSDPAEK